ncbi:hypothetical protein ACRW4E_25265, partial [Escherichia coli]
TGPQSIHILRGVRQQQDEPGRFSICSRQAAVVHAEDKKAIAALDCNDRLVSPEGLAPEWD